MTTPPPSEDWEQRPETLAGAQELRRILVAALIRATWDTP